MGDRLVPLEGKLLSLVIGDDHLDMGIFCEDGPTVIHVTMPLNEIMWLQGTLNDLYGRL